MMCDDGKSLIQRIKDGDENAFADLVRTYERFLVRWATMKCENVEDAREVVQETFLRAAQPKNLATVFDDTHLKRWLFKVLNNQINELYRRKECRVVLVTGGEQAPEEVDSKGTRQDQLIEAEGLTAQRADLEAAMKILTPDQQEALRLHLDGKTLSEIAEIQRVSYGTAALRIHRAKKRLLDGLEGA